MEGEEPPPRKHILRAKYGAITWVPRRDYLEPQPSEAAQSDSHEAPT